MIKGPRLAGARFWLSAQRAFFKDLGIIDANETDILVAVKDGIYNRALFKEAHLKSGMKTLVPVAEFDAENKLCVFNFQDQLSDMKINPGVPFVTLICSFILFESRKDPVIKSAFVFRTVQLVTTFGWLALINRSITKKKSICRVDLLKHPENGRYSSEVLLTRMDGFEWKVPLSQISHTSNNEVMMGVTISVPDQKPRNYVLKVHCLPRSGPYLISDLLYASLHKSTSGIFINQKQTLNAISTPSVKQKEGVNE